MSPLKSLQDHNADSMMDAFHKQSSIVRKYLEMYIKLSLAQGKTVIAEGIHIDADFCQRMIEKYRDNCICFNIMLNNPQELTKRTQVRSKEFSINPSKNEYVKQFNNIEKL